MNKNLTIKDIAKAAGVSETTISRYLNKKYEYMSEKTRIKIEKVISELDYRPSSVARSLKSQKSKLIGAVIADIGNHFSAEIIKGLSDSCELLGYTLLIGISDESAEKERIQIERFIDNQVEGLIVNTSGDNQEYLKQLGKGSIPLVLLDRGVPESSLSLVSTDNYSIGREAMRYVIKAGFQSIGFFVNPLTNTVRTERLQAFKDGLAGNEGVIGETYIVDTTNHRDLKKSLESFSRLPKPSLIFSANGVLALSLLEVMITEKCHINNEVGFLSFDELPWAKVLNPSITTIDQSSYELGVTASKQLIQQIEENKGEKETRLFGQIMFRESTSYLN